MTDLYQKLLMEHSHHPRNFRKADHANRTAEASNPLCGDRVALYVELEGGIIEDISFQGEGCAILRAATSMMTEAVKGKSTADAQRLVGLFHCLVTGQDEVESEELGALAAFGSVRYYPARIKCATLGWHTLRAALEGKGATVPAD
ncbi:MAG: SUF system NifU family Fe-S cluster assembly protein [Chloroflexi bacterium]|nr:SUF system NifU family Fe-S cluster assembly protein [Chloroflexota bacterium]